MTKTYYVHQGKKSAPILVIAGLILFSIGEFLDYRAGTSSYLLQLVGMGLMCAALYYIWQNEKAESPVSLGEIVKAAVVGLVFGALASFIALSQSLFLRYLAQLPAMLCLCNLLVAAIYVVQVGSTKNWWKDSRGHISWAVPLAVIALWLIIAAGATLFAESPVLLFQSVGHLLEPIRWWAILLVPLSLIILMLRNRGLYNKYKGGG